MVMPRRGRTTLGCLLMMLLGAAGVYFGVNIGEVYFRFYQYQDAMRQEVRFAAHNTDAQIVQHLRQKADSLDLPESAGEVSVQRDGRHIELEAEYYVHLELPLHVREVHFDAHASGVF